MGGQGNQLRVRDLRESQGMEGYHGFGPKVRTTRCRYLDLSPKVKHGILCQVCNLENLKPRVKTNGKDYGVPS